MAACAATGAGFLLAVLWFDLMFDTQTRGHAEGPLPTEVLASISAYYRRVTTDAYPMNRLVAVVMVLTLAATIAEIFEGANPWWISWVSLALLGSGVITTASRTVRNAQRLGRAEDTLETQSTLARGIYRDHLLAFARVIVVLVLQLLAN